jgi:hypothetical protein
MALKNDNPEKSIAVLETKINGIETTLNEVRSDVKDLVQFRWKMTGLVLGISGIVSTIMSFIIKLL